MPIVQSNRSKITQIDSGIQPTDNKYVLLVRGKSPYINAGTIEDFLFSFPNPPIIDTNGYKQSGIKLFMKDTHRGFRYYTKKLDLTDKHKETTEEEFEDYFLEWISLYLYKKPDKFPQGGKLGLDLDSEDFEDPDDMPPIDKGLDEIGITKADFKI